MVNAVIIPTPRRQTPEAVDITGLDDMTAALSGYVENVEMAHPLFNMLVNEEGKVLNLPVNRRATAMLWVHNGGLAGRDVICGPALLIGPLDAAGEYTDLPREIEDLIFGPQLFDIEIVQPNPREVHTIEHGFTAWAEAYEAAVRLVGLYGADFKVRAA